jgi:hypothetical protein
VGAGGAVGGGVSGAAVSGETSSLVVIARIRCIGLASILLLSACTATDEHGGLAEAEQVVALTALFDLSEPVGTVLGDFSHLLSWPDGFVLADVTSAQLVLYDRTGHRTGTLGRPGAGPGEFRRIGPIALASDTVVMALDLDLQRTSYWNLTTKKQIGVERKLEIPNVPYTLLAANGQLIVGDVWPKEMTSLVIYDSATHVPRARGATPPALYHGSPYVAGAFAAISLLARGDSLLVGWSIVDSLQLFSADLGPGRMIAVPKSFRRGTPSDLIHLGKGPGDIVGMLPHTSLLSKMGNLRGGTIGLLHVDLTREVDGRGMTRGGTREVWLTTLDWSGAPRCVDLRIATLTEDVVRGHFLDGELLISRTSAEDGVTRFYRAELPKWCVE